MIYNQRTCNPRNTRTFFLLIALTVYMMMLPLNISRLTNKCLKTVEQKGLATLQFSQYRYFLNFNYVPLTKKFNNTAGLPET